MKTFAIVLISATLVFALPFEESGKSNETSEDGWFVPQSDGTLKWTTKEEAAKAEHQLTPRLFGLGALKVKFYLYTRNNPKKPQQIFPDNAKSLKESNFNSNHQTRFIIHGYLNSYKSPVNVEIRGAFLDVFDCNVISVDWSQKAKSLNYLYSQSKVPKVGEKVAEMIDFLATEGNMSLKDLQIVGHSLGAHVAGFAGKHVTTGTIHTIIGLDPAWPLYTFQRCDNRLCDSDAEYVESIHTNGGLLGFLNPIGKAAFYPNGGKSQPGCEWDLTGTCSHLRSYVYYSESIRKNNFVSVHCSDWEYAVKRTCNSGVSKFAAKLGSILNFKNADGYFYTPVNRKAPYGTG